MTALSDRLVAANVEGHSARALSRLARDRGHSINHDTVARYLRGAHGTPDEATLIGFADVLNIPLRELRVAAGLPSELTAPYVPPVEASRLSRRQRRALDEIIRSMVEPTRAGADGTSPAESALSRAARRGDPEDVDSGADGV